MVRTLKMLPVLKRCFCITVLSALAFHPSSEIWATNHQAIKKQAVTPAVACIAPDRSEVRIPAGTFVMGSPRDDEGPVHKVQISAFWMDRFDVTNAQFAEFVAASGYVTDAERNPAPADFPDLSPKDLVAGGAVFVPSSNASPPRSEMQWWRFVPMANWRHPFGPASTVAGQENMPVVQVSYRDAVAYAQWAGRELPSEEQYEYAARGGLEAKTYPWGEELKPNGKWLANVWQGEFPRQSIAEDGYPGLAPAGCFPPNAYGLHDIVGNVWKWTSSLYSPWDSTAVPASRVVHVTKGGSFLCSATYCRRFRPSARQPQESGFSSMHLGFRTVRNENGGMAVKVDKPSKP